MQQDTIDTQIIDTTRKEKTTILCIEDDDADRYAISKILRGEGYEILEAADGKQGLVLLKKRPALVILDVNLPDINGFELCKKIIEDPELSQTVVVILSGAFQDDLSRVKGFESGAVNYLMKPVESKVLAASVKSMLRMQRAEQELVNALRQWRFILNAMKNPICRMDINGKIAQCNKAMMDLCEKPLTELAGSACWEVIEGKQTPGENCAFIRMKQTKKRESHVFSRNEHIFQCSVDPVLNHAGVLVGAVRSLEDITKARQMEAALRASEERYRNFLQNFDGMAFERDLEFSPLFLKGKVEEISGYAEEELLAGHPRWDQIVKPDDLLAIYDVMSKVKSTPNYSTFYDYRLITKAGGMRWVREFMQTIYDESAKPIKVRGIMHDITEYKIAEEKIKENEKKFQLIDELSADIIIQMDDKGIITYISSAVEKVIAYTPQEILKKAFTILLPSSDIPRIVEIFRKIMKGESGGLIEIQLVKKDGSCIPAEISLDAIRQEERVIGLLGVIRDISVRKRAEDQIKASLKEKEILLREIHHRVKNNMAVICSLLYLQEGYIQEEEQKKIFEDSIARIKSMALVHEKLYKSKDLAHINVNLYLREIAERLFNAYAIPAGKITLTTDIGLVELPIDLAIPCGLIINELISNSLKYAFSQGREGTIHLALCDHAQGHISLTVSDDGIGFPRDVDFQNVQSLGLRLVRLLVRQIRGTIELKRERGAHFEISFQVE